LNFAGTIALVAAASSQNSRILCEYCAIILLAYASLDAAISGYHPSTVGTFAEISYLAMAFRDSALINFAALTAFSLYGSRRGPHKGGINLAQIIARLFSPVHALMDPTIAALFRRPISRGIMPSAEEGRGLSLSRLPKKPD